MKKSNPSFPATIMPTHRVPKAASKAMPKGGPMDMKDVKTVYKTPHKSPLTKSKV